MKPAPPTFDFGKHKGRTVEEVLEIEPGYIEWFFTHVEKEKHPKSLTRAVYKDACHAAEDRDADRFMAYDMDDDYMTFHD